MITAETRIAQPFRPRDWVQLTLAFRQILSAVGENIGLAHACINRWLREGRLHLGLVAPDGTIKVYEASDCQRLTVCAPHNPAEGVSVEPYEAPGRDFYVLRAELDKECPDASNRGAREPKPSLPRKEAAPKPRRKPKVDPIVAVLKELYPPDGDVPDMPPKTDVQILGQIERHNSELEDMFSEDSVNRARKKTREAASKK